MKAHKNLGLPQKEIWFFRFWRREIRIPSASARKFLLFFLRRMGVLIGTPMSVPILSGDRESEIFFSFLSLENS